ncbi:MAG: hypothetical protein NC821_04120 [Candidatus Omnitrophica bacterium]|nr:hypothetical protein [Candidatus Omnitrophota bacterium]
MRRIRTLAKITKTEREIKVTLGEEDIWDVFSSPSHEPPFISSTNIKFTDGPPPGFEIKVAHKGEGRPGDPPEYRGKGVFEVFELNLGNIKFFELEKYKLLNFSLKVLNTNRPELPITLHLYIDVHRAIQSVTDRWPNFISQRPKGYKDYVFTVGEDLQNIIIPLEEIIYPEHLEGLIRLGRELGKEVPLIITMQEWVWSGEQTEFFVGNQFYFVKP